MRSLLLFSYQQISNADSGVVHRTQFDNLHNHFLLKVSLWLSKASQGSYAVADMSRKLEEEERLVLEAVEPAERVKADSEIVMVDWFYG